MKNLLLIFTRNPELGKCKTRLAATIGDEAALRMYEFLLKHTVAITKDLPVRKQVYYSVKVRENDLWDANIFSKKQQHGTHLGERMQHAFAQGFEQGYERIVIIGSDLYDLTQSDLENAFSALSDHDFVIGPAEDGGYYLLGMKRLKTEIFQNKNWGTASVLKDTLLNLKTESVHLLPERNDIDVYEDIKDMEVFRQFLTP
jgi:hypothetical protein